jgi:hypothetical protein
MYTKSRYANLVDIMATLSVIMRIATITVMTKQLRIKLAMKLV